MLFVIAASIAHANSQKNSVAPESIDTIIKGFVPSPPDEGNPREGKTLVNTFPFNQQSADSLPGLPGSHGRHDHHDHHDHHGHHNERIDIVHADSREARQRNRQRQGGRGNQGSGEGGEGVSNIDEVFAAYNNGQRCVDKVEMVEYTEYDDEVTCQHSYSEQCHDTYVTDYKPAQKEECEENFVKNCHIEYKKSVQQQNVNVCIQQQVCSGEGPSVQKTLYNTVCETSYEIHKVKDDVVDCKTVYEEDCRDVTQGYTTSEECTKWPKVECDLNTVDREKYTPITECRKVPKIATVPGGCVLEPGPTTCHDETQAVVNPVSSIYSYTLQIHASMTSFFYC